MGYMFTVARFNKHFGTDFDENEVMKAIDLALVWADDHDMEDGETDEHYYAAIEMVLAEREMAQ